MSFADTSRLAAQSIEQAVADDDSAFNAQHAMARAAQRATEQIVAEGNERWRRGEAERRAAEGDSQRFLAEDDEEARRQPPPSQPAVAGPTAHPPVPGRAAAATNDVDGADDADDTDRTPDRWLT